MIRSNLPFWKRSKAALPLIAVSTKCPSASRSLLMESQTSGSSSTTRIRLDEMPIPLQIKVLGGRFRFQTCSKGVEDHDAQSTSGSMTLPLSVLAYCDHKCPLCGHETTDAWRRAQ